MKTMPDNVVHYRSSPEFTEATVPAALQRGHNTAAGVWGRITILEGSLCYKITDPSVPAEQLLLTPEQPGIVEPGIEHEVNLIGPVRFRVDFHRLPD